MSAPQLGAVFEIPGGTWGEVWSDGPEASSVWLAVEGNYSGPFVAVKLATKAHPPRVIHSWGFSHEMAREANNLHLASEANLARARRARLEAARPGLSDAARDWYLAHPTYYAEAVAS